MKKYFKLLLMLTISFPIIISAQNIEIRGKVIDQENKEVLPFSTIEIKSLKTGTYSDKTGYFITSIPENNLEDSIEFSSIAYDTKKMKIKDLLVTDQNTIQLKKKIYQLQEVVIVPKNSKTIKLGITIDKPWSSQVCNIFGAQIGSRIPNKKGKKGIVKAVSYYIYDKGQTNTPFRVRIYGYDKVKKCPGEDLIKENVIVTNNNGPGWFRVDLSKYNITFPKDGIYVIMEWIFTGDQYYYYEEVRVKSEDGEPKKEKRKFYGQTLGQLNKQKDGYWFNSLGVEWAMCKLYYKGYPNAMINAEVELSE